MCDTSYLQHFLLEPKKNKNQEKYLKLVHPKYNTQYTYSTDDAYTRNPHTLTRVIPSANNCKNRKFERGRPDESISTIEARP